MENKLLVKFICGIGKDGIEATVINPEDEILLNKELTYGENVSSSRKDATEYKPFIGEVLIDIVETYFVNDIYYSGYYLKEMTKEEVKEKVNTILREL